MGGADASSGLNAAAHAIMSTRQTTRPSSIMRLSCRLRQTTRAAFGTPLMALLVTACAVPGAPPDSSIYPEGHPEAVNDPGLVLAVDFKRRTIRIEIYGEHYDGELVQIANGRGFESKLRSVGDDTMHCMMGEPLTDVWHGECTDSRQRVFVLQIGSPMHV